MIDTEPQPAVREPEYVPRPMVFAPARSIEYPALDELPQEQVESFSFLQDEAFDPAEYDEWPPVATGSKVGGWTNWWNTGTSARPCPECGAPWRQTLSLATYEGSKDRVGWQFGDRGNLNVLLCSRNVHHSLSVVVD